MIRPGSRLGYLEIVLAAALWGSSGIFATRLFRMGVPPESVAVLRPAIAVGFLLLVAASRRADTLRPGRRGLAGMLVLGGVPTGVFQLSYQMGMEAGGVPMTVALVYLAPALVVAVSGPLLGEWPSRARVLLALLSVAGVWLTVLGARGPQGAGAGTSGFAWAGLAWGGLAGASYAAYTLFGRWSSPRWGSLATVLYSTAGGTLLLAVAIPLAGRTVVLPRDGAVWTLLVVFALLTIALASFLFYDALGRIEAGGAAITSTLEPVVAALLAGWLLGQKLTPWGWLGLTLVVVGVAGASRGSTARGPASPDA